MSAKSTAITWLGIGAGALVLYLLYKKQISSAVSSAAASVGSTVASPFESLYTSITGMSPTPIVPVNQTPGGAGLCYQTNPVTGAVTYDSGNNIIQVPCGVGHVGTTPGTATSSNYGS